MSLRAAPKVLGPTLWNLLLDPLLDSVWPEGTKAVAYADDLAIITAHDSRKTLKTGHKQLLNLSLTGPPRTSSSCLRKKRSLWCTSHPHVSITEISDCSSTTPQSNRYLEITINPKFNFEINAAHTTQRARNITLGLRRRAARHWGQSAPATLRAIYRGAILPVLTYASPVWISTIRRSKVNRKYLSLYGTFARLLTNSYLSVSTDAAGVLAGILPIDLEIEGQHFQGAEARWSFYVSG
jgi:hypothetical protein